jgi:hypothetical protein
MSEPRKWFRFSIRDVLWLTFVAALALGWYARERKIGAASDDRLQLIKAVLSTRHQLATELAREQMSGLQAEKAQLEKQIEELKVKESIAELRTEYLLKFQNTLEAESRALGSYAIDSQVASIQRVMDENKALRLQLKVKEAEYEWLKATTAREEVIEVPDEKSSSRPTKKATTRDN